MMNRTMHSLFAAGLAALVLISTGCSDEGSSGPVNADPAYWAGQVSNTTGEGTKEDTAEPHCSKDDAEEDDGWIEGEVISVLESAPVQLVVKTDTGTVRVRIGIPGQHITEITRDGESLHWGTFKGGERIKLSGEEENGSVLADTIEIQ